MTTARAAPRPPLPPWLAPVVAQIFSFFGFFRTVSAFSKVFCKNIEFFWTVSAFLWISLELLRLSQKNKDLEVSSLASPVQPGQACPASLETSKIFVFFWFFWDGFSVFNGFLQKHCVFWDSFSFSMDFTGIAVTVPKN